MLGKATCLSVFEHVVKMQPEMLGKATCLSIFEHVVKMQPGGQMQPV